MEKANNKKVKTDNVLIILIGISLLLLVYSIVYCINYYLNGDILFHYPQNVDSNGKSLNPNEIGDSIGGIMNPIIGLSASVLTFLAFYIQFKANKEQREFFHIGLEKEKQKHENEKKEEKLREIKSHKSNIQILKALINSMIKYYTASGKELKSFIDKEIEKPLGINSLVFVTNSSYENFQKLDLRDLYNSILYSFTDKDFDWENEFVNLLTTIDFYEKLLNDIKLKYDIHVKTKSDNLNAVGGRLNEKMSEVLINPLLNSLDGIEDYMAIVYNTNPNGELIVSMEEFEGADIGKLQDIFFVKFIKSLKGKFDETNNDLYRINLNFFSSNNKAIGAEKFQTKYYVENLIQKYNSYLTEEDTGLQELKDFLNKIQINNLK